MQRRTLTLAAAAVALAATTGAFAQTSKSKIARQLVAFIAERLNRA